MRPTNDFLRMLLAFLCVVVVAALVGSEWTARTGEPLSDYVMPDAQQGQAVASIVPQEQVEEEIPLDQLPETFWAWHLSLFLHDDWRQRPDEARLVSWFTSEPRLAKLKQQVHTHVYTPSNPLFEQRYAKSFPELPGVMLQHPSGHSVYKVGAAVPIPGTSGGLANRIIQAIRERFPCPRPKPGPEPEPVPDETPDTDAIPDMPVIPDTDIDIDEDDEDVVPDVAAELSPGATWSIGILLALIAGAASLLVRYRNDVRNG